MAIPKYPKRSFIYTKDNRCGWYEVHDGVYVLIMVGINPKKCVWYYHGDVYQVIDFDLPVSKHTVYLDPTEGVPTYGGLDKELAKSSGLIPKGM